jgi:hypothetical protein
VQSTCLRGIIAAVFFHLAACGGGGGGQLAGGGIGGTGAALGPVSAKGSLTVNGVKFETDNASVFIEGQQRPTVGDIAPISEGMTVVIRGIYDSASAGRATEVRYLRNLLGPVGAVDLVDSSFTAMGHTVRIDGDPVVGTRMPGLPNRLADLRVGDIVEVSGSADGAMILASLVRRSGSFVNGSSEIEVKAFVSDLDTGATTFKLGDLIVDYDAVTQPRNLTLGDLATSPFVAVKGTTFDANGRLIAASIERIDRAISPGVNRRLELDGIIVGCSAGCGAFSIAGQRVVIDTGTVFRNGGANDLINDRRIEVEGVINAAGELAAGQIAFVKGSVKIEALTDAAADVGAQTVAVLGISVKVNAVIELKDGITLSGIGAGLPLKIQGYRTGNQSMIATRIEALGGGGKTRLEGPLQSSAKANGTFTILGVPVAAGPLTSFADATRTPTAPISRDAFFDTTVTGAIVSVRGAENPDNQIDAEEVEIEAQP